MTTSMSERSSVETGGRITSAWRVVSVTYMSTATHHSSVASASSRRAPPGVESTGLPAKISMPRTWPSPGVVISSARPATGSSPFISGSPLTRCVWRPWSPKPSSRARFSTAPTSNAGLGNIAPPGTSRLPVTALSTLMSQCVSEPVRWWHTPTRPYATARSASANPRASRCDRRLVDARDRRGARDRPVGGKRLDRGDPVGVALEVAEPRAALREQHVQHPEQQVGIAAGGDRDVLGGVRRGLGAARVHDHDAAAARDDRAQPVARARRRHERAVGHRRVRAEHEHVVGAVDVGDREQREVPEHLGRRQMLRQLVGRCRRVVVARVEHVAHRQPGQHRHRVRARVAEVGGDRVVAVAPLDRAQPVRGHVERLVPADLHPLGADPAHRAPESVGIVVQVRERRRLRADVAARDRVLRVAGDPQHAVALDLHVDAAVRLAQRALAMNRLRHAQSLRCCAG